MSQVTLEAAALDILLHKGADVRFDPLQSGFHSCFDILQFKIVSYVLLKMQNNLASTNINFNLFGVKK